MRPGIVVMMLGIFVVPAVLLWLGHRLRRRTPRQRGMFWGALIGHLAAIVTASFAAMLPPHLWAPDDLIRGLAGYASLLILPFIGGVIGALSAPLTDELES